MCELVPHGFYRRVKPRGALIRRFLCRRVRRTVSLLPDCFAAHVTGTLEELEAAVRITEEAASRAVAVERARPPPQGSLASAERWLERRVQWVAVLLVTVKGLCPERFTGVVPTLAGFGQQLDSDTVLRELREVQRRTCRSCRPRWGSATGAEWVSERAPRAGRQKHNSLDCPRPAGGPRVGAIRPVGRLRRPRHDARRRF